MTYTVTLHVTLDARNQAEANERIREIVADVNDLTHVVDTVADDPELDDDADYGLSYEPYDDRE